LKKFEEFLVEVIISLHPEKPKDELEGFTYSTGLVVTCLKKHNIPFTSQAFLKSVSHIHDPLYAYLPDGYTLSINCNPIVCGHNLCETRGGEYPQWKNVYEFEIFLIKLIHRNV